MFNLNVHIYPSNLKNESRLFKEADTLISNKLVKKVVAVGIKDSNTEKLEIRSDNIEIHRIQVWEFFKSTSLNFFLKYFFFQFFVLLKLSRSNIDVINAHNLSVLPVSVLLKIFKKSKLVYDPHELETEVHNSRGLKRKYGKWIERKLITFADEIMVVNESIKNWYENEYDISNIYVVRNVPNIELKKSAKAQNKFREVFNISEEKIIFLYQGLISSARGIDVILNAFKEVNDDKVLVLMGFGPDVD
ncbi:MAG TPA: glycosyl transferase family 1, partial [Balneola sp.]|nr:glycosyl transferase family 1 [Balneola sp.]